jgi:hypothetical protein
MLLDTYFEKLADQIKTPQYAPAPSLFGGYFGSESLLKKFTSPLMLAMRSKNNDRKTEEALLPAPARRTTTVTDEYFDHYFEKHAANGLLWFKRRRRK